ncbi:MAG TPA: hypothetical protein VK602_13750 [Phyllobacterium sp.]|nr:hypothetical protein [Phyllobacterium sp.]
MQDYARPGSFGIVGGLQQTAQNALNQPKELGVIQRVEGLRIGLNELNSKLDAFHDRLHGSASVGENEPRPDVVGIYDNLSEAESLLRHCIGRISDLDNKF